MWLFDCKVGNVCLLPTIQINVGWVKIVAHHFLLNIQKRGNHKGNEVFHASENAIILLIQPKI